MMSAWVLVAFLAEVSGGPSNQVGQHNPINLASQAIVVPLSGATMRCTKEGDHLVCVIPLEKEAAEEVEPAPVAASRASAYKPIRPTPALPGPEVLAQLKTAKANIELAKSLLPKATSPEEAVLAQQMLYRAREHYRTARALLHTVQGDLNHAPDPFDRDKDEDDDSMTALCQSEVDAAEGCDTAAP